MAVTIPIVPTSTAAVGLGVAIGATTGAGVVVGVGGGAVPSHSTIISVCLEEGGGGVKVERERGGEPARKTVRGKT